MLFRSTLVLSLGLALAAQVAPQPHPPASIAVTEAYPDDPALAKVIDPLRVEIKGTFDHVIAHCPKGLSKGGGGRESELGYWMADALRVRAQILVGAPVKFGYTNSGGIRANIRPGAVKVGDIYEVMPFENELMVAELTGAELLEVVKEGILHRSVEPMSGVHVETAGTVDKPVLLITWSDGSPIDPKEVVKIATSDYLVSSSAVLKKLQHPFATGLTMRQVFLDVCVSLESQGKVLEAPPAGRVVIVPELLQALKNHK